jgi:short subunit dehydrogenase-like uncharacterized protein
MNNNKYDFIMFGATSFVGQILSEYMISKYADQENITWAAAGRSKSKLEALRTSLGSKAKGLPLIVADAAVESTLKDMVSQTGVIISTVGPYALYGELLVKVCAETGTDYCDLTGEPQWIREMISKYEETAKNSGARIIHCCGFDSIPSDLGVYYLQQQAKAQFGEVCNHIKMGVKATKGGASGGTIASMLNMVKELVAKPSLRKVLANPYSLCPSDHAFSVRQRSNNRPVFDSDFNTWTAPFVMAGINTKIVHRTNALSGNEYGSDFRYDEAMLMKKGFKAPLLSVGITTAIASFMALATIKPTRMILEKFILPKPGEGPSPEAQKKGFFDLRFIGKTPNGNKMNVKVTGDRDPGYGSTAKVLAETGILLAIGLSKTDKPGGFWTPASAFGNSLIERLKTQAGLTFETI